MRMNFGENEIISGARNDTTGLASHVEQARRIVRIAFDDTFIAGGKNLKFCLQGLIGQTRTDTTPTTGHYTEISILKITNATGEGSSQDVPFVCTGTVIATGRSALSR